MPPEIIDAARPLLARLAAYLDTHPELKAEVATAARAVADWLTPTAPAPIEAAPPPPPVAPPPVTPTIPFEQLEELAARLKFTGPPSAPVFSPFEPARELDLKPLQLVTARCRVKADACRWLAARARNEAERTPLADIDRRAADLSDCRLWMLDPPAGILPKVWDDLAGSFATAADASDLLAAAERSAAQVSDDSPLRDAIYLAAEAQSTLMYAVADTNMVRHDNEQMQLFARIRDIAKDRRIFVNKFLKREDKADPANWPDVQRRIRDQLGRFASNGPVTPARKSNKALQNLRHKLPKLAADPAGLADEWPRVFELIDEAVANGMPPSNAELRDLLWPLRDRVPAELSQPPGVAAVFREMQRYEDNLPPPPAPEVPDEPSAEVAAVAKLITGREVVVIGGQARPQHRDAMCRAFGLTDVRWITTPEHTSYTVFEPDVARPEVALVLLAIRWSSHDYSEVAQYCRKYGKPLVHLPRGYNPNQVAHEILQQAGDRLGSAVAG